jgi:exopolyphosphatase
LLASKLHPVSRTNYSNLRSDLDSLAAAIAYAWYATCYLGQPTVPLLQTPRADLSLRPENLYALEFSGIDTAHLLTGDELPADSPPAGKYALLDHNALTGRFAAHDNMRVIAIVDHHDDEKRHPEASPRIVESPTGSCSSLIGRLIQKEWDSGMSRPVARLLLCAVLIDTGGLKAGGKAEVTDREVAPFLLAKAELVSAGAGTIVDVHDVKEAKELTRILTTRKTSVDLLSPRDLLRRDYKEYRFVPSWTAEGSLLVGLASVPRRIKAITGGGQKGRRELATACAAWIEEKGLDVLGVLTNWKDEGKGGKKGKHRREMLWVVREDEEVEDRLWKGLEGSAELELERKGSRMEEAAGRDLKMRLYEQGDGQATRKVIAPLVRAIIEKIK